MTYRGELSYELLRELLAYDPDTGIFTWKVDVARNVKAGSVAGSTVGIGYRNIRIYRLAYRAHRLAWLFMTGKWPIDMIDHINGVRDDNRFANLREATCEQNRRNSGKHAASGSGFKGVSWKEGRGWRAYIHVQGKQRHLGYFSTPGKAHAAYVAAAKKYHGEFARFE